ncbi:MAG: hypothetical protein D6796_06055 [Caldilineae bacterium]|nr:MAG: hypothetical protein D6796_06055 [Caldilineae bacterium]
MIYVVLGMHKSGTTLVSQILHHSGINMGSHIDARISYDEGNKYERRSTLALNMEILGTDTFNIIDLPAPETLRLTPEQRARMRSIIEECNQRYAHWGFKDPRTTLTYRLWVSELPAHRVIAVYRAPAQIWPRFRYNGVKYFYTNPLRAVKFMRRWCEHNVRILSDLREYAVDFLILNYHALMTTDAEFRRLETFVGQPLQDCRRPDLYRSRLRRAPLLKWAAWWVHRQTGHHPDDIIRRLEALRQMRPPV